MTSLAKFVFVDHRSESDSPQMTAEDRRLTLAYGNLQEVPYNLMDNFGNSVQILDLSHNKFRCLDFLTNFENMSSLILDHNEVSSYVIFPFIPTLQVLWLNHNKIKELFPFIRNLHKSFPNLKYLSLMGNAAAPSYLNGGTFYEYLQYRLFVISWFPQLVHLDDRAVTSEQRKEANRLYKRPVLERLSCTISRFHCMRTIHRRFYRSLVNVESFFPVTQRNRSSVV